MFLLLDMIDRLNLSYIYSFNNILTYVKTPIPTWCYSLTYTKDAFANSVHDNASQIVVNLNYLLVKKELAFMITKTLFMSCYSIICDLSLDSVQHNIIHYIIALTFNSLSQSNFKRTN